MLIINVHALPQKNSILYNIKEDSPFKHTYVVSKNPNFTKGDMLELNNETLKLLRIPLKEFVYNLMESETKVLFQDSNEKLSKLFKLYNYNYISNINDIFTLDFFNPCDTLVETVKDILGVKLSTNGISYREKTITIDYYDEAHFIEDLKNLYIPPFDEEYFNFERQGTFKPQVFDFELFLLDNFKEREKFITEYKYKVAEEFLSFSQKDLYNCSKEIIEVTNQNNYIPYIDIKEILKRRGY